VLEHELGGLPRRDEHVSAPTIMAEVSGYRSPGPRQTSTRSQPPSDVGGAGPGRDAMVRENPNTIESEANEALSRSSMTGERLAQESVMPESWDALGCWCILQPRHGVAAKGGVAP
jgi:hypothetical protein